MKSTINKASRGHAKPLHAVLVGCGGMSAEWLEAAAKFDDLKIVGLVDLHPEAARARAAQFQLSQSIVFDRLDRAIDNSGAGAVFDVTVPAAHYGVTMTSLRRGCHVLGEKPMSDSLPRARRMVAAAREARRHYAVIQNRRYEAGIRAVRAATDAGGIGRVEEVHADFFLGPHFGGFRDTMAFPLLIDMAIHTFDAARYLSGADAVAAYCHSFNPKRSWFQGDASAACVFEMSRGVTFVYRGSWCAEGLRTKWNSAWRLVGSLGTLTWDGADDIRMEVRQSPANRGELYSPVKEMAVKRARLRHEGHTGLIREFIDCVHEGRRPETHAADNIKSLAMVLAAVESAKRKRRVTIRV